MRLTPVEEAATALYSLAEPVAPESLSLTEAIGHVLAQSILAPQPVPPTPVALRDGWAVSALDTVGTSPLTPLWLAASPARVRVSDAMPANTDAVLPLDRMVRHPGGWEIIAAVAPGEGVRWPGGDLVEGAELARMGSILGQRTALVTALAGQREVAVRRPRVAILAVQPAGSEAGPAILAAIARAAGARVWLKEVPADHVAIAAALVPGDGGSPTLAAAADMIVVVGGAGYSAVDQSAEALATAGRCLVHGVALRPGECAGVGEAGGRPVLLSPARMEEALAVGVAFLRPVLDHLAGRRRPDPGSWGQLTSKIASRIGWTELVLLRHGTSGSLWPLCSGEAPLAAVIEADALLLVPPESEGYAAGQPTPALLLSDLMGSLS